MWKMKEVDPIPLTEEEQKQAEYMKGLCEYMYEGSYRLIVEGSISKCLDKVIKKQKKEEKRKPRTVLENAEREPVEEIPKSWVET